MLMQNHQIRNVIGTTRLHNILCHITAAIYTL